MERVRRSTKIMNFPNHTSRSYYSTEKKKKTSDDFENGASLSQIGRCCPPLSYIDNPIVYKL